jgi:hypothetical protein
MELTKQQSNVMAALKQGNEALKKAQQEVRSAGSTSQIHVQQQPAAATAAAVCVGWAAQQGCLLQLLTVQATTVVNRTARYTATAAIACVSWEAQLGSAAAVGATCPHIIASQLRRPADSTLSFC